MERLPGDRYLLLKPRGLYLREGLNGTDKLLVDVARITLAPAGRGKGANAIAYCPASPDGKYVAVGITPGGSETDTEIHVFETDSGRETGDVVLHAFTRPLDPLARRFWLPDSHSFVYRRFRELPSGNGGDVYQRLPTYLHVRVLIGQQVQIIAVDCDRRRRGGCARPRLGGAVLLTTGMNDVHVIPWQMAKMAARLQAATTSGKPVLLLVHWGGGHGVGGAAMPDMLSFLLWQMGVPEFQPPGESEPSGRRSQPTAMCSRRPRSPSPMTARR